MILIISKTNTAEIKYSVKVSLNKMRTNRMVVLKTWKTTKGDISMLLAVNLLPETFSFKY